MQDKRILVTGASRGLGSVCARALAGAGASLALMARTEADLAKVRDSCARPERHACLPVDLTDFDRLGAAVDQAKSFLGGIDVVLHVAGGGLGLREPLLSSSDFLKLFTLNVLVATEINRRVAPGMVEKKSGNLVHVGSIASSEATASVGYNTVKSALAAYVRSLGRELAPSGIVVTGILPGGFYAPGNSWMRLESKSPEVVSRFVAERLPRGFLGKAEELIPLVMLLCSDAASMMGGCLVPIDAGEGKGYVTP
ncbi:MAG: hypothetical protein A3G34_09240 [Candidatus Lindowbacteria bacterium RIFCSPLOWO2_12_FULL_62_27]|nr:MAG: hypothetical protein A3I06_07905 [Candidatus Lindowbacteria bacterium RIFCSPLOWO2_02_FULL_62_12]OGH60444.1 MAG: hypothetical protein A3G34_09240 [Candidatus Lindowbacteria bacterium RIFCSPLOWO2_12_FULL_62_27]